MQGLRFALIQMSVGLNKTENVKHACKLIRQAASEGAKLIALPECFNSPYGTKHFPAYAEKIPGPTTSSLSSEAKACQIYLIGGSIPESDTDGKLYNTCTVFNPSGEMIAKFRKMHLFDIDIPGKIRFQESEVLSPGNRFVSFNAGTIKVGLAICYDLRFAEVGQIYAQMGCHLIVYPGAFNMTTGPAHWKLLQRARAVDNQIYIAGVSPARDERADYIAYGHSMVINPWGEMVASAEAEEKIVYSNLDIERMNEVRRNVPLSSQRRHDIYTTSCQKSNGPLANTQTEKLPFDFSNVD